MMMMTMSDFFFVFLVYSSISFLQQKIKHLDRVLLIKLSHRKAFFLRVCIKCYKELKQNKDNKCSHSIDSHDDEIFIFTYFTFLYIFIRQQ